MKLVEILAEELEAWPDGVTHLTQSSVDREIYDARDGKEEDSVDSLNPRFDARRSHSEEKRYPIVTRAQWQAERDRQKGGEWKRHRGSGKQPKELGDFPFEVKHRDGNIWPVKGIGDSCWRWTHDGSNDDIMAYRIISQPQAEEVGVDKFCMGYKCNATADNITHSIECEAEHEASYTGTWCQSSSPLAWRDTIIHCQAIIEDCEREIRLNTQRLAAEGFELIAKINSNLDKIDATLESSVDMSDWRNWKIGDIIRVTGSDEINDGEYPIRNMENEEYKGDLPVAFDNDCYTSWPEISEMRFIRRP